MYEEVSITLDDEITCFGCSDGFEEEMKSLAHEQEPLEEIGG